MHFSVAVRKQRITERQKIRLENVVFIMRICACLSLCVRVMRCVCWDRSILRALVMRLKLEAYELCTLSNLSLIREQKLNEREEGRSEGSREQPSHRFCCIWSIGLQPSDTNLLRLLLLGGKEGRGGKKRDGGKRRQRSRKEDRSGGEETRNWGEGGGDVKWDEETHEEQRKWSQRRWRCRESSAAWKSIVV